MPQHWIDAGRASELAPGRMKRIDANGRRVLLANVGGQFYAADDTCTHEDASLSTGSLQGACVKCPLHGSRFSVCTGEALEDPAEQNLRTYPVRLEGERILIALREAGTP